MRDEISDKIQKIDEATKGYCVYPVGMNPDCVDCTICRQAFLEKIGRILERGGDANLLLIRDGEIDGIL